MTAELIRRLRRPRAMPGVPVFAAALEAEHDLREAADRLAAAERVVEAVRNLPLHASVTREMGVYVIDPPHAYDALMRAVDGYEKAYSSVHTDIQAADVDDRNSSKPGRCVVGKGGCDSWRGHVEGCTYDLNSEKPRG